MVEGLPVLVARRRAAWTGAGWLLLPALLVLLAFFALPMGTILVYSVGRSAPGALYVPDLTLANYVTLLETPVYFKVMMRTLRLGLIVTLLALVMGYPY